MSEPKLDLFRVPDIDYNYQNYRISTYSPIGTGITPLEFIVGGLEDFVDLTRSYFTIQLTLETATGKPIKADADDQSDANQVFFVYPVNNFAHSLVKQLNVRLNGMLLSPQTDTYAYKAYIETLLNYTKQEGATLLAPQGWVNQINVPAKIASTNEGTDDKPNTTGWAWNATPVNAIKTFAKKFHEKAEVSLVLRPAMELFHAPRLLIPQVEMKFQFSFHSQDFFLFGTKMTGKQAIVLKPSNLKMEFHCCRVGLNPSVRQDLLTQRLTNNTMTPMVRSELRSYTFAGDTTRFQQDKIFSGRVPDRVIVGLVESTAFNGSLQMYPFAFQKFGVTRIRQVISGEEYPYSEALELNGTDGAKDLVGYFHLLQASGAVANSREFMITPEDWGYNNNCNLFMWCNVPSGNADGPRMNPRQAGDLRIDIDFNTAPGKNITVLVWGEFEAILQIDPKGAGEYNIREFG